MSKRLVICCDGTWSRADQKHPTNVIKLRNAIAAADRSGAEQRVTYREGVGVSFGERIRGGVFGHGLSREVRNAYRTIVQTYDPDDEIFLFGYSRNIVLITTAGLTLLVATVCLVGAIRPDALPLCFGPEPPAASGQPVRGPAGVACPSEDRPPSPGRTIRRLPAPGDVTLVALVGLLGVVSPAQSQSATCRARLPRYDVPVALALLKLPSGALAALVGLLFVHGGFIPGLSQLDSQPQILAYAFLFGAAQQLVTGLVDRQAQDILAKVPSKEPVSATPQSPPAEAPIRTPRLSQRLSRLLRLPGT